MNEGAGFMDFWDNIAGFYDLAEAVNGKVYEQMLSITARLVPKGARVLDCAAGTGALPATLAFSAARSYFRFERQ